MMLTQRKMQYDKAGPKVAEALNKRYFEAYYCSGRAEALEKILENWRTGMCEPYAPAAGSAEELRLKLAVQKG